MAPDNPRISLPSRARAWGLRGVRILLGWVLAGFLSRLATAGFHRWNPAHSAWERGAATVGGLWILAAITAHLLRRHAVAVDLWIVFMLQWLIPGALLALILNAGH